LFSKSATVRWLEKNGYDVAYQSGVDTARYGRAGRKAMRRPSFIAEWCIVQILERIANLRSQQ